MNVNVFSTISTERLCVSESEKTKKLFFFIRNWIEKFTQHKFRLKTVSLFTLSYFYVLPVSSVSFYNSLYLRFYSMFLFLFCRLFAAMIFHFEFCIYSFMICNVMRAVNWFNEFTTDSFDKKNNMQKLLFGSLYSLFPFLSLAFNTISVSLFHFSLLFLVSFAIRIDRQWWCRLSFNDPLSFQCETEKKEERKKYWKLFTSSAIVSLWLFFSFVAFSLFPYFSFNL